MTGTREEGHAFQPDGGDFCTPDAQPDAGVDPAPGSTRSLLEDVEDLLLDARTYFDAELTYQVSRASFVGGSIKRIAVFGIAALVLALFAFCALTIGLIIALTPLVTAWGATAIVVGAMLLVAFLLVRAAAKNWSEMMSVINDKHPDAEEEG